MICRYIYIYIERERYTCLGRVWMEPAKRPRNMIGRGITKGT